MIGDDGRVRKDASLSSVPTTTMKHWIRKLFKDEPATELAVAEVVWQWSLKNPRSWFNPDAVMNNGL